MFVKNSQQMLCRIILCILALVKLTRTEENTEDSYYDGDDYEDETEKTEAGLGTTEGTEEVVYEYDYAHEQDESDYAHEQNESFNKVKDIFHKHPRLKQAFLKQELVKQRFQRYLQAIIVEAQNHNWAIDDVKVQNVVPIQPEVLLTG